LEYFTRCLAIELEQIKEKVKKLSLDDKLKDKLGRQIALSERQIKLVEYLKGHERMVMQEAKKLIPKVSEDTILRDLKDLMKKSIVRKKGRTKAASYVLVS
jgi:predicted HTH transcriptional regulator